MLFGIVDAPPSSPGGEWWVVALVACWRCDFGNMSLQKAAPATAKKGRMCWKSARDQAETGASVAPDVLVFGFGVKT